MSKKKNELVCCLHCGRDTRSLKGICIRCSGGPSSKVPISSGRKEATLAERRAIEELGYSRDIDEKGYSDLGYDRDDYTDPERHA